MTYPSVHSLAQNWLTGYGKFSRDDIANNLAGKTDTELADEVITGLGISSYSQNDLAIAFAALRPVVEAGFQVGKGVVMTANAAAEHAKMQKLVNDFGELTTGHTPRNAIFALSFVIGKIIADGPPDEAARKRTRDKAIEVIDMAIGGGLERGRRH